MITSAYVKQCVKQCVKQAQDSNDTVVDRYGVPTALVAGGAGTAAGSIGARKLFKKYMMPTSGRYSDLKKMFEDTKKFTDVAYASNEAAPYLYAELGHQASTSVPMSAPGATYITPGEAAQRAKNKLTRDLKTNKHIPKMLRAMIPNARMAPSEDTLRHYGAFSRSPIEGYLKTIEEASSQGSKQFNMGQLKHVLSDIIADTPISSWNEEFGRRLAPTSEFMDMKDMLFKGKQSARAANVTPFISKIMDYAGIPAAHNMNSDQIRQLLSSKGFFTEVADTDTPAALLRSHIAHSYLPTSPAGSISNLSELKFKPHVIQELMDPIVAANFRDAAAMYGKFRRPMNALRILGTKHTLAAALGVAGLGTAIAGSRLLSKDNKKTAQARSDHRELGSDAMLAAGGLGAAPISYALWNDLKRKGLSSYNPFSKNHVAVVGGIKDMASVMPGTPMDSFSGQSNAVARELRNAGFDVDFIRGHTAGQIEKKLPYRIANTNALDDILKRVNAIVQVGTQAAEHRLDKSILDPAGVKRYRVLSDFGPGNLNQPNNWLNTLNWMKVQDDPKQYDRFIVPGGKDFKMDKLGRRSNVNIAGIPVSELFTKHKFNVPLAGGGAPATGIVTVGGGAMGFSLFDDIVDKARSLPHETMYDYSKPSVLDDIANAMRQKHGDNFKLNVLTGSLAGNKGLQELAENIKADTSGRWNNVNFIFNSIKQSQLRDMYANSHYTFAIPGSTSSEYMAMAGRPGKFVSLVPNESYSWMPGHFSTNAEYVQKNLPMSSTLNLNNTNDNRVKELLAALSKEAPAGVDLSNRKGVVADFSPFVKTLKRDLMMGKLKRLGKAGLIASIPAALIAGGVALRHHNKPETPLEKIKEMPRSVYQRLKDRIHQSS